MTRSFDPFVKIRMWKRLLLPIFFLAAQLAQAATESVPSYGQLGFSMADQGISARAVALGSSFVGVGGDISCLSWNPAGLAGLPSLQLAFYHNFYLQDYLQDSVALAAPGPLGTWAFSAGYLSYGSLTGRDASGNVTGNYSAGRWDGELAWALKLFRDLSLGLGVKGNLMTLGADSYANVAGDAGILWDLGRHFHLGVSYANWGTDVGSNIANSILRVGGSTTWDLAKDNRFLLAAGMSWEPYGATHLNIGAEDVLASLLALRAGYNWDSTPTALQGLTGLTAGAGFNLKDFSLDYAYSPFGDLGTSNQVSLVYRFPAPSPTPTPARVVKPALPSLPFNVPTPVRAVPVTFYAAPTPKPSPVVPSMEPGNTAKLKLLFSMPGGQAAAATADPLAAKTQPFQDAIAQDPRNFNAWYQLGMLYYQNQRKDEAVQCFEQVLRLKPNNPKLRDWLERYKNQAP